MRRYVALIGLSILGALIGLFPAWAILYVPRTKHLHAAVYWGFMSLPILLPFGIVCGVLTGTILAMVRMKAKRGIITIISTLIGACLAAIIGALIDWIYIETLTADQKLAQGNLFMKYGIVMGAVIGLTAGISKKALQKRGA
jgi:MFS family permease